MARVIAASRDDQEQVRSVTVQFVLTENLSKELRGRFYYRPLEGGTYFYVTMQQYLTL